MPRSRSLANEGEGELAQVVLWVVEGHVEQAILEAIADKWPQFDGPRLLAAARKRIERLGEEAPPRAWILAGLREIYRRALEAGELAVALRTLEKIGRWRPPPKEE